MSEGTNQGRDDQGRFTESHSISTKHGGESALKRIQKGEPFNGAAQAAYQGVLDEIGVNLDALAGIDRVRVKRAARFEAVARLFEAAAMHAASVGDLESWERFERRAGWIGSKAFNALGDVRPVVGAGDALDYEAFLARQRDNGK
jgi:hypothetical protein